MFVAFLGLMTGIVFSRLFLFSTIDGLTASLFVILFILAVVLLYIYARDSEKLNKLSRARKDMSAILKLTSVFALTFFVLGVVLSAGALTKIEAFQATDEERVSGVVADYVVSEDSYMYFLLTDCKVGGEDLDCDVIVYTSAFADIDFGDRVSFRDSLTPLNPSNKYDFSKLINGVGYTTYINISDMVIADGDASIRDIIKNNTRGVLLSSGIGEDNANIMFSILYGDKRDIDTGIKEQFSYSGISHILAVSGLHVSVLFAGIYFILKKLKVNKYIRLVILSSIFGFYCYLCSFTPSVCRASIMSILAVTCDIFDLEYDPLSSLSISGIVILLISPLQLFSISFQLSYLCVFAIISFAPFITKLFLKIKCPKTLAETLAISISVNIVLLPVMVNSFSKVSMLGILANIVVIPIFSIMFTLLSIAVVLSLIFKGLACLILVPNIFLHCIRLITTFITSLPFGVFRVFNVGYLLLLLVVVLCIFLHFVMISRPIKTFISLALVGLSIGFYVGSMIPNDYDGDNVFVLSSRSSQIVFYIKEDSVTMLGSNIEESELMLQLKSLKVDSIDRIIAYDLNLNALHKLSNISSEYEVKDIYIPKHIYYDSLKIKDVNIIPYDGELKLESITIKDTSHIKDMPALLFDIKNTEFLIANDVNKSESIYLSSVIDKLDYLIVDNLDTKLNLDKINPKHIISYKLQETSLNNVQFLSIYDKIRVRI